MNELTPIFNEKQIRKIRFKGEWWFSVLDIIASVTESENPLAYWQQVKNEKNELIVRQLKLTASDGKKYPTDCATSKGIFRIIQSIPSSKAEPFKCWLAQVGAERIKEMENPELGITRVKNIYAQKGYRKDWVDIRLHGMVVSSSLTDEWSERGAQKPTDRETLTNDIMEGAFDLKVDNYKKLKGLEDENLRDHMTDMELVLTMVAEVTTKALTEKNNSQGMSQLREDAKMGGAVAGKTRKAIEMAVGRSVISKENFLTSNSTTSDAIASTGNSVSKRKKPKY